MSAVNITAIQQYAETHKMELLTLATTDAREIFEHFTVIPGIKDKHTLTTLEMKKLLKPYKKDWNAAANKADLVPRTLRVEVGQVELEEEPMKYRKTYLAKLMQGGVNPTDHPFEKELLEAIARQTNTDINDDLIFHGVRNAAGADPVDVNDGFLKIIEVETTPPAAGVDPNLIPIATGIIDSTNAVTKLKAMYRAIPAGYRRRAVKMYISHDIYDAYCDHYQSMNKSLPYNDKFEKVFLEGSGQKCELVPLSAMGTSMRVIISPKENMCIGIDLESDQEEVAITQGINPKVIGIFLALAFGVQIASLKAIWVNDQV